MGNETALTKRTRKRFPRSEPADLAWLILHCNLVAELFQKLLAGDFDVLGTVTAPA